MNLQLKPQHDSLPRTCCAYCFSCQDLFTLEPLQSGVQSFSDFSFNCLRILKSDTRILNLHQIAYRNLMSSNHKSFPPIYK